MVTMDFSFPYEVSNQVAVSLVIATNKEETIDKVVMG